MPHPSVPQSLRAGLFTAAALASATAFADPAPALDRVSLWLGGYYADTELSIEAHSRDDSLSTGRVDVTGGHATVGRARLDLLLWDSQGLTLDYYSLSHASTRSLSREFNYAGVPFAIDSTLTARFDLTAGSVAYHWWFGDARDAFGVGLGATYYRATLGVVGSVTVDDVLIGANARWQESAVAPLLNLAYKHAFSNNLRIYAHASGVRKNGGPLTGYTYDARLGLEWFPWQNVGLGAEYGTTRIHLDRVASSYGADLDIKLHGPSLFARLRF